MLQIRSLCFYGAIVFPFLALPIAAQQSTSAMRDQRAVSAIQTALQGMGGVAAWTQIQDSTEEGTCTDNVSQGEGPSQFIWTAQSGSFRYQNTGSDGKQYILVSGHGRPARSNGKTTKPLSLRTSSLMLPYQLPGLVLTQALNNTNYRLKYIGSTTWNQNPAILVQIVRTYGGRSEDSGAAQRWYLNPQTMQPIAVTYLAPGEQDANYYVQMSYSYSQYQAANGLSIPENIVSGIAGTDVQQQCAIQQIHFNTSPSDSSFDLPLSEGGAN